jgi:hypothetical protein
MGEIIIFVICLIGCGVHCYKTGNRDGISGTLDIMEKEGYITFDD